MDFYKSLIDDFKGLVKKERLSHAYLFSGQEEQNKFDFAQSLANFLENGKFEIPSVALRETLVISPNDKGSVGIDSVRGLKEFLWQKTSIQKQIRIAVIRGAESLTAEAQNSALKIVEEPPQNSLIIFIINNENNLLPALNSRLQKIYFPSLLEKKKSKINEDILSSELSEEEIDLFFKDLIGSLSEDSIKNFKELKRALRRLSFIKRFNTNKRLQLKTLLPWKKT